MQKLVPKSPVQILQSLFTPKQAVLHHPATTLMSNHPSNPHLTFIYAVFCIPLMLVMQERYSVAEERPFG